MLVKAAKANPETFVAPDLENQRAAKKSANKYMDVHVTIDGKKRKFGFGWKLVPLSGRIKDPEERLGYAPTIQFRRSSGDLGEAAVLAYECLESAVEKGKENKTVVTKKGKGNFCTIVQTELESGEKLDDEIVRFKLPFDNSGKPLFRLIKIENRNGVPTQVAVKCTEANVHTIIKSRMLTSGYVSADTMVFSGFGISIPAKVQLLVIKDVEPEAPSPDEFMSNEELLAMAGEPDADNAKPEEPEEDDEEEGDEKKEKELTTEERLEQLKLAANN
jgi:hypothetical protein